MRKYIILILMSTIMGTFVTCSGDEDEPMANSRLVRYEITGNYTGKIIVVYNDNVSGNTVINDIALPWAVEVTYSTNVLAIGIGAQSSLSTGGHGQVANMRILLNGKVVKSSTSTAGSVGEIVLPALAYVF